ncbi:hypothetical protein C8Q79DRAFT_610310 [Trametes meyenii]|nr:hypothetical protein C8Q79DRAFT_610310 [Trametes meyenii]
MFLAPAPQPMGHHNQRPAAAASWAELEQLPARCPRPQASQPPRQISVRPITLNVSRNLVPSTSRRRPGRARARIHALMQMFVRPWALSALRRRAMATVRTVNFARRWTMHNELYGRAPNPGRK